MAGHRGAVGRASFHSGQLASPGRVVVAFLAGWCPFCRDFLPELQALADAGRTVEIADVSDQRSPLWEEFSIDVVPTVILFQDGSPVERFDGRRGVGLTASALRRLRKSSGRSPSEDPF